jgi:hypothetical protein
MARLTSLRWQICKLANKNYEKYRGAEELSFRIGRIVRVYIAESVTPEEFFDRDWEGHVVEEIVRLLGAQPFYNIVMTAGLLDKALQQAKEDNCDVFHLSCHGNENGIFLTDETFLSWNQLALKFKKTAYAPEALVLSSCLGGDRGAANAFRDVDPRPAVIFGSEADEPHEITFPGACIAWPILYTELVRRMGREVFRGAVRKMNSVTPHRFVYWRWHFDRYKRYRSED